MHARRDFATMTIDDRSGIRGRERERNVQTRSLELFDDDSGLNFFDAIFFEKRIKRS